MNLKGIGLWSVRKEHFSIFTCVFAREYQSHVCGKSLDKIHVFVTLIYFLRKALQYVLCLCRLMYAVGREFILMILSDISKCTTQCDFLVWLFANNVYSILCDICLTRGSKCTNHPKSSSEFVVFMSIFLFLFCDWFILLGRVDNPVKDELDIA